MINPFKVKKMGALFLAALLTTICFYIGLTFYSFWIALVLMGCGLTVSVLLGGILLKNPFTDMLEGKGVLSFNIDSTGIIQPFLIRIAQPYLHGKLNGKNIKDVFDRKAVFTLTAPKKVEKKGWWNTKGKVPEGAECNAVGVEDKEKKGGIVYYLSEKVLNASRFGFYQWPCMIWNDHLKCFITKEYISNLESTSFAEHQILYMNRQMEDLTAHTRDFGRYVVEAIKPISGIFRSPWFWIILVVFIAIMIILFLPAIIGEAKDMMASAAGNIAPSPSGAVTPR
jgi:hypothetical protein